MAKIRHAFISFQHNDVDKARGLQLMSHAPNVDLKFSGRHLIKPVDSTNRNYITRSIREQVNGSSVTVLLAGKDTASSGWIAEEIRLSNEKDPPNGFVVIKLSADAAIPDGIPEHAEILNWLDPSDVAQFGPAIERAAAARDFAPKVAAITPGTGSSCGRAA
jgi:hypothetical protein